MAAYTDDRAALSPLTLRVSAETRAALRRYAGVLSNACGRRVTIGEAGRELLEKAVEIALRDGTLDVNERMLDEVLVNVLFARKVLEQQAAGRRSDWISRLMRACRNAVARARRSTLARQGAQDPVQ